MQAIDAYQEHITAAIALVKAEILSLENEGTRNGCVVGSVTGKTHYRQFHWCHDGQREYVSKKNLPTVKAECERGDSVRSL